MDTPKISYDKGNYFLGGGDYGGDYEFLSRDEIILLLHYKDKIAEKLNLCDTILFDELQQEQVLTEEEAQSINVYRVSVNHADLRPVHT